MCLRRKFELLSYGIILSPRARGVLPRFHGGTVTVRDYPTTSGLVLRLPDDHYVNARVHVTAPAAFLLDHDGSRFILATAGEPIPVDVFPPAQYAIDNRRLRSGRSIRVAANTHADRVRLTPIYGCAATCQFCNYPGMVYRRNTIDELEEALRIALDDRIIHPPHVLVSGGSPRNDEPNYAYLNDIYQELPHRFPGVPFDVMLAPRTLHAGPRTARTYANFAQRLKAWGYHAISVNLEVNSDEASRRFIPEKHEIGRDNYLLFMERAVDAFGPGEVRSVLLVGLEPEEETLKAVDAIAARGVLVELSPFTAFPGTMLERHPEPTPDELMSVYERAMEITVRHGIPLGYFCVPCGHNIL